MGMGREGSREVIRSGGSSILCLGRGTGQGFLFGDKRGMKRRRRETAIAEGRKPLTTRGSGERRKLPSIFF